MDNVTRSIAESTRHLQDPKPPFPLFGPPAEYAHGRAFRMRHFFLPIPSNCYRNKGLTLMKREVYVSGMQGD